MESFAFPGKIRETSVFYSFHFCKPIILWETALLIDGCKKAPFTSLLYYYEEALDQGGPPLRLMLKHPSVYQGAIF